MTLRRKQTEFVWMVAQLLVWARSQGYEITFGEAWRIGDPMLHGMRLAIDLNLFIDGKYRRDTEAHRPLGEKWESMGGSWGGRFKKPDGNHHSLSHKGIR